MTTDHQAQVEAALKAFNAWIEFPMTEEEDAWNETARGLMNFTAGWLAALASESPAPTAREPLPPARGQKMRDAGFTPRDTRLTCDECGAKFTRQFAPLHECEARDPSSKWPFEQPHVARDLLARLYATMGGVRDAKLEAKIDVFLAATKGRSGATPEESDLNSGDLIAAMLRDGAGS